MGDTTRVAGNDQEMVQTDGQVATLWLDPSGAAVVGVEERPPETPGCRNREAVIDPKLEEGAAD